MRAYVLLSLSSLSLIAFAAAEGPLFKAGMEERLFADGFEAPAVPGAPIAHAGVDRNVAVGDPQVLDGSGSSDPSGQPLRYRWVLKSKPAGSQAELREATTAYPALVPDVAGAYWLELTVNNGVQDSLPDPIRVRAFANFGVDSDGDGLGDALERSLGLNPYEEDSFGDGIRDADRDLDNDGLTIRQELLLGLDPIRADSDGNGINDGDEDPDRDDLSNRREFQLGTRPLSRDSDGDGWPDGAEVDGLSNPTDPQSRPNLAVAMPSNGHGLVRVDLGDTGGLGINTVVAQPFNGHGLTRVDLGDTGGLGLNTVVAQPFNGHGLVRVDLGDTGGLGLNTVVAQPFNGHGVTRVDLGDTGGLGLNTVVAQPPATLRRNQ